MQKSKKIKKIIPEDFKTIEEAGNFWDKHDLGDYWESTREVKFDVRVSPTPRYIPLEKGIAKVVVRIARHQHISTETLINLWLKEKLLQKGAVLQV